jgi:predicted nucleic acid-binding protein
MTDRILVDTNILVYAYDADAAEKHVKAKEMIDTLWEYSRGVLPTQVLAEFFITITRKVKQPLSVADARDIIEDYRSAWAIFPTTPDTVLLAIDGVQRHQFSFWDSMIWASAVINGISKIFTEDMQHGQTFEGVRIENPLLAFTEE